MATYTPWPPNNLLDFCRGVQVGGQIRRNHSVSEVKLDILREYAAPYSKILTSSGFYHLYIDAYAAGGSHVSRTTGEVVPGSPLVALSTKPPFHEYHFIDANPGRVEQLRSV